MKTGQSEYENAEIKARMMGHIEELLEQMIPDTIHGVFCSFPKR